MSRETISHLNTNVLIGNTTERGHAWHYRASEQGEEPNHYDGPVPVEAVQRRLFGWDALPAPIVAHVPAGIEDATGMDDQGRPFRAIPAPGRQAVVRSDTGDVLGVFKSGYKVHDYRAWLLDTVADLVGERLGISSAGLLKGGAQAWVEVSMPETLHSDALGLDYRPNLLACTSHDGSIATTIKRTVTATVCDNTLWMARGEHGQQVKIRHSSGSLHRITEAREALGIIEQTAGEVEEELQRLASITVTDRQLARFFDQWAPVEGLKGASLTRAERRREEVAAMYHNDKRAADWAGTAFGVHQAVNTWAHHSQAVRGQSRADRNAALTIAGGFDKLAAEVDAALSLALA